MAWSMRNVCGRRAGRALMAAMLGAAGWTGVTRADVLVDTIGSTFGPMGMQNVVQSYQFGNQLRTAAKFSVPAGSSQYTLDGVVIPIQESGGGSDCDHLLRVSIAQDVGGPSIAPLETLAQSVQVTTGPLFPLSTTSTSFGSAAHPTLQPGTSYWIVVEPARVAVDGAPKTYEWAMGAVQSSVLLQSYSGTFPPAWQINTVQSMPLAFKVLVTQANQVCCNNSTGACVVLGSAACAALGRTPQFAASCSPSPCPISAAPGACCRGTTCSITSSAGLCTGGTFLGSSTTCAPVVRGGTVNACCPADFNNSGAANVADIFDFLSSWFAGCP